MPRGQVNKSRELIKEVLEQEKYIGDTAELELAEIYLALDEQDLAAEQGLLAYKRAWADGLPFSWWSGLKRAEQVLTALGVELPEMLRSIRSKVEPVPYEDQIRSFIEELRVKKAAREENSAKD